MLPGKLSDPTLETSGVNEKRRGKKKEEDGRVKEGTGCKSLPWKSTK